MHAGSQALANVPPIGKAVGSLVGRFARASRWQRAGELLHPGNTFADAYRAYRGNFPMCDAVRLAAHFTGASEKSVRETMVPDQTRLPQNPLDAVSYLEITRFMRNQLLRDSDVMSMAHGLELRLPLVDQRLFDTIAGIPAAIRLQPGKKLLLDAVPGIPAQVRNARKRGFSFPIRAWLEEDLGADFASATQGLPVGAREWYQKWSVLTFTRWLGAHA